MPDEPSLHGGQGLSCSMSRRVLIVGGVAGGAAAATRLRRLNEAAEIVLFDRGPHVSFANCGLPYYVGNVIPDEGKLLVASRELFRERFNIGRPHRARDPGNRSGRADHSRA